MKHQVEQQRRALVRLQGQPQASEQLGEVDADRVGVVGVAAALAGKMNERCNKLNQLLNTLNLKL